MYKPTETGGVTADGPLPRRKPRAKPRRVEVPPSVRRADAHPDAPSRPPVRAERDLGTPFLDTPLASVDAEGERTIPRDLDTPLAMFDPDALPAAPAAPSPTVKPLFRPAPEAAAHLPEGAGTEDGPDGEETPPPVPSSPALEPPPIEATDAPLVDAPKSSGEPSLSSLLARLDQGLSRRDPPAEPPPVERPKPAEPAPPAEPTVTPEPSGPRVPAGLAATLGQLRRMATGDQQ